MIIDNLTHLFNQSRKWNGIDRRGAFLNALAEFHDSHLTSDCIQHYGWTWDDFLKEELSDYLKNIVPRVQVRLIPIIASRLNKYPDLPEPLILDSAGGTIPRLKPDSRNKLKVTIKRQNKRVRKVVKSKPTSIDSYRLLRLWLECKYWSSESKKRAFIRVLRKHYNGDLLAAIIEKKYDLTWKEYLRSKFESYLLKIPARKQKEMEQLILSDFGDGEPTRKSGLFIPGRTDFQDDISIEKLVEKYSKKTGLGNKASLSLLYLYANEVASIVRVKQP